MKFNTILLGAQSLLWAVVLAAPTSGGIMARNPSPVAFPDDLLFAKRHAEASARAASAIHGLITKRTGDGEDEDNVICSKAKRSAEASAEAAAVAYNTFATALTKREDLGEDEDNVICSKAKREAMASAEAAAEAYQDYAAALAKREDLGEDEDNVICSKAKRDAADASGHYKRFAEAISKRQI